MKDPMLDQDFLRELDHYQHHHVWAKIISLNFEEYPLEEITGRITSGSINVDGTSAVRRTCSLSMVSDTVKITDLYWGLRTKFALYIGLENFINPEYDDIIWFKQGIFFITSFNTNAGTNSYNISIQGKDKMVLLNGEMGGVIPASWDFGTEDVTEKDEDGNIIIQNNDIPIKDIVLQAVHEFAQEPWQNIIVNNLDDYGIELLEYQGDTPFYYIIKKEASGDNNSREIYQMTFDKNLECKIKLVDWNSHEFEEIGWTDGKVSELDSDSLTEAARAAGAMNPPIYSYEKLIEQLDPSGQVTETQNYYRTTIKLGDDDTEYTVAKITSTNGLNVCGYRICDIIYPYDLIASPGDTVTSVLDKLVQMLGNFEYFYDEEGRFIFQKKRTYLDVSYNNIINEHSINPEVWADSSEHSSKYSYNFDKSALISAIQNTPNISNLKNDFSLWGARDFGDNTYPIHLRYAIDHKPFWYTTLDGKHYASAAGAVERTRRQEETVKDGGSVEGYEITDNIIIVDWRELIFQMARDYRKHYRDEDFLLNVQNNNRYSPYDSWYPKGYTGYEKYYIDFEMNFSQGVIAYWRELYNPIAINSEGQKVSLRYTGDDTVETDMEVPAYDAEKVYSKDDRVYVIKDDEKQIYRSLKNDNTSSPLDETGKWIYNPGDFTYNSDGWNMNILDNPEILNFWFDFLDTTGEFNRYSVHNIGARSKATNDDKIKAIYFREVPNVIFDIGEDETQLKRKENWIKPGYCYININKGVADLFTISTRGKNAMDVIEEYLYTYTYPASAISLTCIPIYYLTPNTLIYVDDSETGIVGEYIMQKYSIQLGLSAQMNISAVETAKRIY